MECSRFRPTCPELIGVCGKIASGKSHVAKLIADTYGFKYVNSDALFKSAVRPLSKYKKAATAFFAQRGVKMLTEDGEYNTAAITECLFPQNDPMFTDLAFFSEMNRPFIRDALNEACDTSVPVLLEMATLPAIPEFYYKCTLSLFVTNGIAGEPFRKARLLERDWHRTGNLSVLMDLAQQPAFHYVHQVSRDILNWDNGAFVDDAEVLRQFNNIRSTSMFQSM